MMAQTVKKIKILRFNESKTSNRTTRVNLHGVLVIVLFFGLLLLFLQTFFKDVTFLLII